jgi:hypothetical protein
MPADLHPLALLEIRRSILTKLSRRMRDEGLEESGKPFEEPLVLPDISIEQGP